MGQSTSKAADQGVQYRPKYTVVQTIDDPNYGKVKLVRCETSNSQMILKEYIYDNQKSFDEECAFFKSRATFDHPNIVQVIGYNGDQATNVCSRFYKVNVFIEVLSRELGTELTERIRTQNFFPERELLFLAENMIAALSHLQRSNLTHGDIRPVNIFSTGMNYKLTDPKLEIEKNSTGLAKAIVNKASTLLSPQLLHLVPMRKFENSFNPYKSDVYSLGMTLLALGTRTDPKDLYDYKLGNIDEILLRERLEELRRQYSQFTFELIRDMLLFEEKKRPDFVDLANRIQPYQEMIRNKQDLASVTNRARENSIDGYIERGNFEIVKNAAPKEQQQFKKAPAYPNPFLQQEQEADSRTQIADSYVETRVFQQPFEEKRSYQQQQQQLIEEKRNYQQPIQEKRSFQPENVDARKQMRIKTPEYLETDTSQTEMRLNDLEARIKAAMEKSQETVNRVEGMKERISYREGQGQGTRNNGFYEEPKRAIQGSGRYYAVDEEQVQSQRAPVQDWRRQDDFQGSFGVDPRQERQLRASPPKQNTITSARRPEVDQKAYDDNLASYNYTLGRSSRGPSPTRDHQFRESKDSNYYFQRESAGIPPVGVKVAGGDVAESRGEVAKRSQPVLQHQVSFGAKVHNNQPKNRYENPDLVTFGDNYPIKTFSGEKGYYNWEAELSRPSARERMYMASPNEARFASPNGAFEINQKTYDDNLARYNYTLGRSSRGSSPVREQYGNGTIGQRDSARPQGNAGQNTSLLMWEPGNNQYNNYDRSAGKDVSREWRKPDQSEKTVKSYYSPIEKINGFQNPLRYEQTPNVDQFEYTGPIIYRASYGLSPQKERVSDSGVYNAYGGNSSYKYRY